MKKKYEHDTEGHSFIIIGILDFENCLNLQMVILANFNDRKITSLTAKEKEKLHFLEKIFLSLQKASKGNL